MRLDLFLFAVYNVGMGKITDIARQKRNKSRVSVYIDGEFAIGLDAVTAVAARLAIGDEVSEAELRAVVEKSEINSAFERAVGYLSAAPRARLEIHRYLKDKGYDGKVCDEVLRRLDEYRYVDDRAYAESYVTSKSKKYGKIRLSAELKKKGISSEIVSDVLSGESDDYEDAQEYEETDGAIKVAERYLRSHKERDALKLKRFLAGRGFTWDTINSVVSKLKDGGAFDTETDDEYFYD